MMKKYTATHTEFDPGATKGVNKKNIIIERGTQAAIIQGLRRPPPSFLVHVLSESPPKMGSLKAL